VSASRRAAVGLALVAALLLGARALLPVWLREHVNGVLARAEGYSGGVRDVDVALVRGAYRIEGLEIRKEGGEVPVPLLDADAIDLSIEWLALLRGSLAGEVVMHAPKLNFVAGPRPEQTQTGAGVDWTERLEELFPFSLDRFAVHGGQLHFRDPHREPPVDVALRDVTIEARNLTNSRDLSAQRPARASFSARAERSGRLAGELAIDPFAERPDFELKLELAALPLTELNDFLRAYAGVDVQRGRFDLTSEVVSDEGRFEGWVQPLLRDVDVLRLEEEAGEQGFFATLWEALVGTAAEVIENQPEEQLASRIPLRGSFEEPGIGVVGALVSLFENGYVEALRPRMELIRSRARQGG
jgi:hypothetical protein